VERPAHPTCAALGVEPLRDLERVRVDLEHVAQLGAPPVERLDAADVELSDGAGGVAALAHPLLELCDRGLFELERLGLPRAGRGGAPPFEAFAAAG